MRNIDFERRTMVNGVNSTLLPGKINGAVAYFEVSVLDDDNEDGEEQVASLSDEFDFSRVEKAIEGVAKMISSSLKAVKPTKVSAEIGIEFAVESGQLTALFVKGNGKANLKISLEWVQSTAK
jgi:Trypsin-co-occurring domain 1